MHDTPALQIATLFLCFTAPVSAADLLLADFELVAGLGFDVLAQEVVAMRSPPDDGDTALGPLLGSKVTDCTPTARPIPKQAPAFGEQPGVSIDAIATAQRPIGSTARDRHFDPAAREGIWFGMAGVDQRQRAGVDHHPIGPIQGVVLGLTAVDDGLAPSTQLALDHLP